MKRTPVILDTNILLLFGQQHFDVFSLIDDALDEPYEFIVLDPVMKELEKLAGKGSKDGRAAKLACVLVLQKAEESIPGLLRRLLGHEVKKGSPPSQPLKIAPSSQVHADDAILDFAEGDAIICTLDKGLQRRYKGRLLSVKQGRFAFR